MKIAAILGVKDEADLLPHCITHLRAIGVDLIIAIDAGSTDGSREILEQERQQSPKDFWVFHFSDQNPDADGWGRLNVDLARASQADWVIFLDADEFWIPASGSLKDCASLRDADFLKVHRYNVPLGPDGLMTVGNACPQVADGLSLIVDGIEDFRAHLRDFPETPWIRGVPVPKVAARPALIEHMHDGGHEVEAASGTALRRVTADDLLIAHLPFSTFSRFEQKLANIRKVFAVHDEYFGEHLAWHWRRWLALPDQPSIRREFERQVFTSQEIELHRRDGVIRSAREMFERWAGLRPQLVENEPA